MNKAMNLSEVITRMIEELDLVSVVRCKDCIYGEQDDDGLWSCRDLGCSMGEDGNGFCSYGERGDSE